MLSMLRIKEIHYNYVYGWNNFRQWRSRLSIQGGPLATLKITFIVGSLHITLHFLHLYTLKIGLKYMFVC